ncbi:MAG TPA: two pore domain potassium channel family protein [Pseudomonas sp.]|nr:two pore domain potassium channel family protein [Pseudomonas sp.]
MALLILGILLFLFTAADIIKTTLSTRGGGMLTNGVTRVVWACFFNIARRRGRSKWLEYAGQFVVLSVLMSWIAGLWVSLFLVLASHPGSVVDGTTRMPADLWETFYYAGFTLSTLGVGDYAASADGWRVLTSAAAFCGLTFITAAITYIVPVLSAVSLQNQLSLLVSSMGRTPQEIIVNSWNGSDFSAFYDHASDLRQLLVQHTLNHHAYPVIQCFHNSDAGKNVIPAIATLDEVLRLLDGVSRAVPQERLKQQMLAAALVRHIELQRSSYLGRARANVELGIVDLAPLEAASIPLDESRAAVGELDERRQLLGTMLQSDGWSWRDVYGDSAEYSQH